MATVLVIEDEAAIRDAFTRVLSRAGFEVTAVADGVAALHQIARERFQAVVSDFSMPELGGRGFYEQLEERYPDVAGRVVFVTAYAKDARVREFLDQTGQPVLAKPVEMSDLVNAVCRIAARGSGGPHPPGA